MDRSTGSILTTVLRNAGENFGGREAIIIGRRSQVVTYTELNQKANSFAHALAHVGVRVGDRVAIWMANSVEWPITFFAVQQIGGVAVPINTRLKAREVGYILRKVGAKFLVMQDSFLGKVDAIAVIQEVLEEFKQQTNSETYEEGFPVVIVTSKEKSLNHPFHSFEAMMRLGESLPESKIDAEVEVSDVAAIMFTSGTTSFPKGVMLTHKNLSLLALHVGERQGLSVEDRFYSIAPFFHCAGLQHAILTCLIHGDTYYTAERFQVDEAYDVIAKERCTVYHGPITVLEEISKLPRFKREDFKYFTRAWYSAPAERMANMERIFGAKMCELYGLTETGGNVSMSSPDDPSQIRHDTDGHPQNGIEVRIIDPDTKKALDDGIPGEICVRGWNVMKGYYGDPEATRQGVDSEGWLHTGDQGVKFKDSNVIKFLSRIKDIIRVGGENFSPSEVEELLMEHPAVQEAAVVAIPDPRLDEIPVAFIQIAPGVSILPEDLIRFTAGRLANFKVPKHVFFVEEFPVTEATLRIQKNILIEWALKRLSIEDQDSSDA